MITIAEFKNLIAQACKVKPIPEMLCYIKDLTNNDPRYSFDRVQDSEGGIYVRIFYETILEPSSFYFIASYWMRPSGASYVIMEPISVHEALQVRSEQVN